MRSVALCVGLLFLGWAALGAGCSEGKVSGGDAGVDASDAGDDGSTGGDDGGAGGDDGGAGGDDGGPGGDDGGAGGDDGGAGGDDGGSGGDTGGPSAGCEPLEAASGTIVNVTPAEADSLRATVASAAPGTTILLADGTYDLGGGDNSHRLSFDTPDVTLRSESGDPTAVILDGAYVTGEVVSIAASRVTIAELTIQKAYYHPIHVTGAGAQTIEGVRIYRVRVIDPGEQGIKINQSTAGGWSDRGEVACSHLEMTDAGRPNVRNNCYTGGIDAHQAWGWTVRDNFIRGFWCEAGLSEHGVHFWVTSRDTLVERNTIVDCARGIGFGLGATGNGNERPYPDDPYPEADYVGHYDGIIRNNFIAATSSALFSSQSGFDAGISLDQARGTEVVHNTVASSQAPFSSIEWRFPNTVVHLANNLVTHNLRDRGGNDTDEVMEGNLDGVSATWFEDLAAGDLHLTGAASGAVDQGVGLPPGLCDEDLDGQTRDASPDVGADEQL